MAVLEHLILCPRAGLCNRVRTISSAKRLASRYGFKLTLFWTWGDYYALFQPDASMDWISEIPQELESTYLEIRHWDREKHTVRGWRRLPVTEGRGIILKTGQPFRATEESHLDPFELKPFLPRPVNHIMDKVIAFKAAHFSRRTIGMHIRRTDMYVANRDSPDEVFVRAANRLVGDGYDIFLATDNGETEQMMRKRFGNRIISYPKNPDLIKRWPRKEFCYEETVDDLVDLHILAACEFIVGSFGSSYSQIAIDYSRNSERCWIARLPRGREFSSDDF